MLTIWKSEYWVYGNSLYYLYKFSVNLKLFQKINFIKKKTKNTDSRAFTVVI